MVAAVPASAKATFSARMKRDSSPPDAILVSGPNGAPGWLIKVDRASGKLLGYVDAIGNHGMDVMPNGDLLAAGPGQDRHPQRYRATSIRPPQ